MSIWQPGDPLYPHPEHSGDDDTQTIRLMASPLNDHPGKCAPDRYDDVCLYSEDAARWPVPLPRDDLEERWI